MSPSDSNCLKGLSESHLAQPSQPLKWYSFDCLILLSFGVICYGHPVPLPDGSLEMAMWSSLAH